MARVRVVVRAGLCPFGPSYAIAGFHNTGRTNVLMNLRHVSSAGPWKIGNFFVGGPGSLTVESEPTRSKADPERVLGKEGTTCPCSVPNARRRPVVSLRASNLLYAETISKPPVLMTDVVRRAGVVVRRLPLGLTG